MEFLSGKQIGMLELDKALQHRTRITISNRGKKKFRRSVVPPRSEVYAIEPWGTVIVMLHISADDLNNNREYAVGILNYELYERRRREPPFTGIETQHDQCFRELEFGWISGETYRTARTRVEIDGELIHPGRPGRPVSPMRRAAIKALVCQLYLKKSWLEITKRVCPCGDSHLDSNKVVALCQPKLETQVRFLKRLLKDCDIQLTGELPARAIMFFD